MIPEIGKKVKLKGGTVTGVIMGKTHIKQIDLDGIETEWDEWIVEWGNRPNLWRFRMEEELEIIQ